MPLCKTCQKIEEQTVGKNGQAIVKWHCFAKEDDGTGVLRCHTLVPKAKRRLCEAHSDLLLACARCAKSLQKPESFLKKLIKLFYKNDSG